MNTRLLMMVEDYERRATECRLEARHFRVHGKVIWARASHANARRYEKQAADCRESIRRNEEVQS